MVLSMLSKTSHWKGNESQDIVTLLETILMLTKMGTQLQEEKGFVKSTR
jgi:hypothetical protein